MMLLKILICAVGSYLLGSVNSGIIFTKLFTGLDLRTQGSGNAGSTNAYRVLGVWRTLLVVLGDALKGVIAVLLCGLILGHEGRICSFLFVILGHVYPVFYGFKGGKGVLTTAAITAVFDWRIAVGLLIVFLIFVVATRYVSLGSVMGAASMPFLVYGFSGGDVVFTFCATFISVWVIILHKDNLIRLKNGTESKIKLNKHMTVSKADPAQGKTEQK